MTLWQSGSSVVARGKVKRQISSETATSGNLNGSLCHCGSIAWQWVTAAAGGEAARQ